MFVLFWMRPLPDGKKTDSRPQGLGKELMWGVSNICLMLTMTITTRSVNSLYRRR